MECCGQDSVSSSFALFILRIFMLFKVIALYVCILISRNLCWLSNLRWILVFELPIFCLFHCTCWLIEHSLCQINNSSFPPPWFQDIFLIKMIPLCMSILWLILRDFETLHDFTCDNCQLDEIDAVGTQPNTNFLVFTS